MVNQAFRIKIAYWSKKEEEKEKKENTRDRSVPDGSDKKTLILRLIATCLHNFASLNRASMNV